MRKMKIELEKRHKKLDKIIQKAGSALLDPPTDSLRAVSDNGRYRYYIRSGFDDRFGKYVKQADIPKAAAIAQRDYNMLAMRAAKVEQTAIEALLGVYENVDPVEDVYDGLSVPRRELVHPLAVSNEEYARLWLAQEYQTKGFAEGTPEYYSANGLRVRSKSEALIADMYDRYKIPMKYEAPITLWNGNTVYTDFELLNVAERKIYVHEHLGMADDPAYMRQAVRRIRDLQLSGYILGGNLIITMETRDTPLDMKVVQVIIENLMKPLSS